jgi:hypothetical protein
MMEEWYYTSHGQQLGPVGQEYLQQLALEGRLAREERVWRDGFPGWVLASAVPGLIVPGRPHQAPLIVAAAQSWEVATDEAEDLPFRPLRRRKKHSDQPPAVVTTRIGLIVCASVLGVALLIVLVQLVFVRLLDPANYSTFAAKYVVDLKPGQSDSKTQYFKKGQWVSMQLNRQTGSGAFQVLVKDRQNQIVFRGDQIPGGQQDIGFEIRESDYHTIEILNAGKDDGSLIVNYTAR